MKEYDLFSSIGELDEKLLRRYGQESAPTPQRRRWIRQLLTHAILLLLILGLIAWLLLGRRPVNQELNILRQALDASESENASADQAEAFYKLLLDGLKNAEEGFSFGTVTRAEVISAAEPPAPMKGAPFSLAVWDEDGNCAVLTRQRPNNVATFEWILYNGKLVYTQQGKQMD